MTRINKQVQEGCRIQDHHKNFMLFLYTSNLSILLHIYLGFYIQSENKIEKTTQFTITLE